MNVPALTGGNDMLLPEVTLSVSVLIPIETESSSQHIQVAIGIEV